MTSERRNHGSGHSYWIDGQKVPGVTTILKAYPKSLEDWAAKESAGYAIDHWDELAELTLSKRYELIRGARFETLNKAKLRGNQLHRYAEILGSDPAAEIDVSEEDLARVDNYLAFVRDWEPYELLVERPFFNRTYRYGGTPDLVAVLRDGLVWLLDYKTSDKGVFQEAVLQCAANRYAEYVLAADGTEQPLPRIDRVGVVNVRADGYDLYPVEADEEAFQTFLHVLEVSRFIGGGEVAGDYRNGNERRIGAALLPPPREVTTP